MKIAFNILVFCLITCTSLMAQERTDAYFNQAAEDICICMSDFVKLQEKAILLGNEGKKDEFNAALEEMKKEGKKIEPCINSLMMKYPDIDGNKDYERRAEEALKRVCTVLGNTPENSNSTEDDILIEENSEELEETEIREEKEFKVFAADICDCVAKEEGLVKELETLKAEGNQTKLATFRKAIPSKNPKLVLCLNEVNEKHTKVLEKKSSVNKIEILQEICPTYLDLLGLE